MTYAERVAQLLAILIDELKGDVHRRGALLLVLDLSLGKSRAAIQAPVNRLRTAIDMAILEHPRESTQLLRLVFGIHCAVGMIPVAQDPKAFEVRALRLDLLLGKGAAGGAKRASVELLTGAALFLLDLQLNRQPVAIPAGHVRSVEALEKA